jgi:hypothetical protein
MMSSRDGIVIESATSEHATELARCLRADDVLELLAAGTTPLKGLMHAYRSSVVAKTAFVDGDIAAMWGISGSPLQRIGRPWLLTALPVERVKVSFLRIARAEVATMLAFCPELRGYVDARYSRALRLLSVVGFELSAEFPFGPNGLAFRQYCMRRRG